MLNFDTGAASTHWECYLHYPACVFFKESKPLDLDRFLIKTDIYLKENESLLTVWNWWMILSFLLFSAFFGFITFYQESQENSFSNYDNTNYSSGIQVGGNDIVPLLRHHKLVPEPADNHYKVSQGIMVEFPNLSINCQYYHLCFVESSNTLHYEIRIFEQVV